MPEGGVVGVVYIYIYSPYVLPTSLIGCPNPYEGHTVHMCCTSLNVAMLLCNVWLTVLHSSLAVVMVVVWHRYVLLLGGSILCVINNHLHTICVFAI